MDTMDTMDTMDIIESNRLELLYLVNNFNNTIEINNLIIKEKIQRKLDIIKYMIQNGFRVINYDNIKSKCILDKLNEIDCINSIDNIEKYSKINCIYNEELNKLLGKILHNIYEYSGYQVLLSNVPNTLSKNNTKYIDSENIYDTIVHYIGPSVKHVFQIANGTYLIQFTNNISAKECCTLLNNNMIGKNIINVEYIKNTENIKNTDNTVNTENIKNTVNTKNTDNNIYKIYKYFMSFF